MNIDTVIFYYLTQEKSIHNVLANLRCKSWALLAIKKWYKQTHSVRYFKNIDTFMLYHLNIEVSIHYVLDNLLS